MCQRNDLARLRAELLAERAAVRKEHDAVKEIKREAEVEVGSRFVLSCTKLVDPNNLNCFAKCLAEGRGSGDAPRAPEAVRGVSRLEDKEE